MCVSPTLVSEDHPLDRLLSVSIALHMGWADAPAPESIDLGSLAGVEADLAAAVSAHLAAVVALIKGQNTAAENLVVTGQARWDAVIAAPDLLAPEFTPRAHAFHMRLASKHGDFYRSVESRALLQWVEAARFRSRYLAAVALSQGGKVSSAVAEVQCISDDWRTAISPRLPGLAAVERQGRQWADACGDAAASHVLAQREATFAGRGAPYSEDGPEVWAKPRGVEAILRLGLAATVIEWPKSSGQTQI